MSATAASADALTAALGELAALGTDQDRAAITDLAGRLAAQRLRILVAGEAKRGKSTLVNALLGRPVLPVGVTPLTALATTVRHGPAEEVTVRTGDGQIRQYPLSALDDLVTERGNPGNQRNLSAVTVSVSAPLLARGVELVDTPGTGSVHSQNTAEADHAITTMDAAIFVLSTDPPVSASERDLIARVAGASVSMFVVLNKADRLSGTDLTEVLDFTEEVTARAAGQPVAIYPVSARAALSDAGDPGFARFLADLTGYLDARRASDLRRSVERHARRMALSLRDEVLLSRRAGRSQGAEADQRVQAFAARLAEVRDHRRDAADLVAAEARRMLAALNQAAQDDATAAARRVGSDLDDVLDGALGSASAGEIERAGRARLADLAVREAEAWRQARTTALEDGLNRLDERLTTKLAGELATVRRAAADLLGLTLTVAPASERLAPDLRFFYQVTEPAGQTELLAGVVRRRLPGEAGRNLARTRLRREVPALVARQFGRARADLQYRLGDATRRLQRAVDTRYLDGTGRLERALADAERMRGATAEQVAAHDRDLDTRMTAIEQVLDLLDSVRTDEACRAADRPGAEQVNAEQINAGGPVAPA
jgi:small GTP-binding protein